MDGYFYFFFKKHILQISCDLYFILPDPPDLQEIAKHADNQHFHYSHPKPTPNGASLVFTLRWLRKKMVLRSSSRYAALHKRMVLRSSSRYAALRKRMVLRSSSRYAALRKRMVLRKKLCLLTADF